MIDDHTKANDQLQQVAAGQGLTLPTAPDAVDNAEAAQLSSLDGAAFDRAYIKDQRKAHRQAVHLFEHESSRGRNPALTQFASATLPTLEDHLKMVQALPLK